MRLGDSHFMNSVSVALIDNHPITIEGLMHVLKLHEDFSMVANGTTSQDALAIAERYRPELMILGLSKPDDAIDTIEAIKVKHPSIKIMTLIGSSSIEYGVRAIEAGARGYVSKTCTITEFMRAVREIASGGLYVSQNFGSGVINPLRHASMRKVVSQPLQLSNREEQIMCLLLGGKTNKEIATDLGIVERTVKHYLTILMQKLNVRNRVEVVIAAQKLKRSSNVSLGIEPSGVSFG
jgi:two-component system nitrate/nitrite response regulator NarL